VSTESFQRARVLREDFR